MWGNPLGKNTDCPDGQFSCLLYKSKFVTTETQQARIFLVDDHPIVRQGLAQIIRQEDDMITVGQASSAEEALEPSGITGTNANFVITDISLKGGSGLELTKSIVSLNSKINVLVISMHDESIYIDRVLRAGAKGYLMKQEATEHVISAIRKIKAGEIYVSGKSRNSMVTQYGRGNGSTPFLSAEKLSDREVEVLHLIGQGLATQKIADQLKLSVKTVESHYANIKNKLDLKNSHQLIQYAVKWCLAEK